MGEAAIVDLPELLTDDPHADPFAYLGFIRHPDGSFTRRAEFPSVPASSDPSKSEPVLTKDVTINEEKKTWARITLPKQALDSDKITKLPLMFDSHGGGFVAFSAASAWYKDYYTIMATEIPAVIVSVEYRLAPEHRLPVAYEDCVEALHWVKDSDDEWLVKYADYSNCFLLGTSAGGNIAYNVGLRVCSSVDDLRPLCIKGMILKQPFFGGPQRTQSELRLADDKICPPCVMYACWEMSLPEGADRNHEYCNPTVGMDEKTHPIHEIKRLGWKILVKGCHGDNLIDHQVAFVKALEKNGVEVVGSFDEGGFHGIEVLVEDKLKSFCQLIKEVFMRD